MKNKEYLLKGRDGDFVVTGTLRTITINGTTYKIIFNKINNRLFNASEYYTGLAFDCCYPTIKETLSVVIDKIKSAKEYIDNTIQHTPHINK